jgi:hypothetical protein
MKNRMIWKVLIPFLVAGGTVIQQQAYGFRGEKPGLIGAQYGSADLTDLEDVSRLDGLACSWSENDGYGREWSGKWEGLIVAPASGEITFQVETDRRVKILIAGKQITAVEQGKRAGNLYMIKGKEYPIEITYVHDGQPYDDYLNVQWSWAGRDAVSIGAAGLFYTDNQGQKWIQKAHEANEDEDDDGQGDIENDADRIVRTVTAAKESDAANAQIPALVGLICEKKDFKEPASRDIIKHVNHTWTSGPGDWSGYWQGYIKALATTEVTFTAGAYNGIRLGVGRKASRPVQVIVGENGKIQAVDGSKSIDVMPYEAGRNLRFKISADVDTRKFQLAIDGKEPLLEAAFAEQADNLQRISFRAGRYRRLGIGSKKAGGDLPNAGDPLEEVVYYINNVSIMP